MSHATHCCVQHGCKYGERDCPVVNKVEPQVYPCEVCGWECQDEAFLEIAHLMNEVFTSESENAKLKADAERYRWLRDESWKDHKFSCAHAVIPAHGQRLTAAIDAARQPNTGGIDR